MFRGARGNSPDREIISGERNGPDVLEGYIINVEIYVEEEASLCLMVSVIRNPLAGALLIFYSWGEWFSLKVPFFPCDSSHVISDFRLCDSWGNINASEIKEHTILAYIDGLFRT